jgi:hypothetical protein
MIGVEPQYLGKMLPSLCTIIGAFPLLQQLAGMGDLLRGQSQRTARLQTVRKKGNAY